MSYYEADAFARWAGARLPTEAEWEIATDGSSRSRATFWKASVSTPRRRPRRTTPRRRRSSSATSGNGRSSPYTPYPGYRPAAGALGEYNGKFMCNQMVLRGGSCATPALAHPEHLPQLLPA